MSATPWDRVAVIFLTIIGVVSIDAIIVIVSLQRYIDGACK